MFCAAIKLILVEVFCAAIKLTVVEVCCAAIKLIVVEVSVLCCHQVDSDRGKCFVLPSS